MCDRKSIVYIIDDDPSVCRGLALLLESRGFVIRTFTCAADFLTFRHFNLPSCLILDVWLPDISGLELQETIAARQLAIPVVFITGRGDIAMSVKCMKMGAVDFLLKPFDREKPLDAVRQAISKSKVQLEEQAEILKIKERMAKLSARELEVFRLVTKGMLSKQIARELGVVLQTVKVHRSRVMQKMQAKSVINLSRFAEAIGIL